MDAVLTEPQVFILSDFIEDELDSPSLYREQQEYAHEVSLWVKNKNVVKPSTNITISAKLEPGVYTADYDRDEGYYCRKLDITSDELFIFSDSISSQLLKEVELFWTKKDLYKEKNYIHKRGILLEGYPGTGKSSIITQISNEIIQQGGIVFKVTGFRNLDNYVGFMRTGFRKIEPDTPVVTILEDINEYEEVESELLDFLDGKTNINHHVIIATTNNTTKIPDTLLRPSRLDLRIEIPMPSEQTRREYFIYKNVDSSLIEELVEKSKDCSLADLKEIYICVFLLDYSISDAITKVVTVKDKKNFLISPRKSAKISL